MDQECDIFEIKDLNHLVISLQTEMI